jgi:hypothetical protein
VRAVFPEAAPEVFTNVANACTDGELFSAADANADSCAVFSTLATNKATS